MLSKLKSKHSFPVFILPVLIVVFLTGCDEKNNVIITPGEDNIVEFLNGEPGYTVFAQLIEGTTIKSTLSGHANYTLLAPNDAAFAKLPDGYFDDLTIAQRNMILRYHLISGSIQITNENNNETLKSVQGDELFITVTEGQAKVNSNASVISKNIGVSNGVIHEVDEVLFPDVFRTVLENIQKRYTMNSLYNQFEELGLDELLDGEEHVSLVLPPALIYNDIEGWMDMSLTDNQMREIWKYNMISANLNGFSQGTQTALQTIQGDSLYLTIIHPGQYLFNTYSDVNTTPTKVIRSSNGAIYEHAGLLMPDKYLGVLTLMDKRYYLSNVRIGFAKAKMTGRMYNSMANPNEQFTVFIPMNGSPGLENLPEDQDELAEILKYHVVLEKLSADDLQHNQTYTTWSGEELTITRNGDVIMLNGTTTIKMTDLEGTNGVVHIIDNILTP